MTLKIRLWSRAKEEGEEGEGDEKKRRKISPSSGQRQTRRRERRREKQRDKMNESKSRRNDGGPKHESCVILKHSPPPPHQAPLTSTTSLSAHSELLGGNRHASRTWKTLNPSDHHTSLSLSLPRLPAPRAACKKGARLCTARVPERKRGGGYGRVRNATQHTDTCGKGNESKFPFVGRPGDFFEKNLANLSFHVSTVVGTLN